jgi:conjugative relaxase-like TrwC/TraI family protein
MIRMIHCQSSGQAKDYFNNQLSQSDYYLNDQELKGTLRGKLARRLSIEGEATKDVFQALCDNINPVTGQSLTPRTVDNRRVGYDINFHCPKSVSVLHALAKDNHILDAFTESVQETMLDIEADAKGRVRKAGKNENRETGELLWADFVHQTARPVDDGTAPDPHLHCHCFTFNATWDDIEKQYKAGEFHDIKRDMPYYQARFHKRLADRLIQSGYQVRRTRTAFEVEGVPQPVIDLFSKRTDAIGRVIRENNITDAKQKDKVGARTRAKKQKGTMALLKTEWRRQIIEAGMTDAGKGTKGLRFVKDRETDAATAAECVDHALLEKYERASVVHDRRVLECAYRHALGKSGDGLDRITDAFRQDKRIIQVKDGSRTLCTTKEVLAEERRMVVLARNKGNFIPLYAQLPDMALEGAHKQAVGNILTSSDQTSIILGRAGSGKTTMLKELVRLIGEAGKSVIPVAPTAQASRGVLREEGFQDAETVAKLLTDPELQKRLTGQVLLVDEAGLAGTKDMLALLELATKHNARLILCGDTRQNSAVVRGDALRILNTVAGIPAAQVNKIYRQKSKDYKDAVQFISDGDIKAGFAKLESIGAIKELDPIHPYEGLANDYAAALQKGKTVLAISPTHKEGAAVTKAIRGKLRDLGLLDTREIPVLSLVNLSMTEAEKSDPRNYAPGHILQFSQNRPGIVRGSRWAVKEAKAKELILENGKGQTLSFPASKTNDFDVYQQTEIALAKGDAIRITKNGFDAADKRLNNGQVLQVAGVDKKGRIIAETNGGRAIFTLDTQFGHVAYAHCITSYSSQGRTTDEVFIAQPAATFPATNLKQYYVSVSRGRDAVHIYTDDKEALLDYASQSGDRVGAMELVAPRINPLARKMSQRGRQDHTVSLSRPIEPFPQQFVRSHAPKPTL